MQKREKILLGLSVAAVATYVAVTVVAPPPSEEDFGGGAADVGVVSAEALQAAQARFDRLERQIRSAPDIYREYYQLVGPEGSSTSEGARADLEFQRAVAAMCENAGFPRPDISKDVERIRDVDDYLLVLISVDLRDGDLTRVSELLKVFERSGLIIWSVDLAARRDSDQISAKITVGRLVENYLG